MEQQLEDREGIKDTADLQARFIAIRDSITTDQLRNYFDGMKARMELVVKLQGAHIGKSWRALLPSTAITTASVTFLAIGHMSTELAAICDKR